MFIISARYEIINAPISGYIIRHKITLPLTTIAHRLVEKE